LRATGAAESERIRAEAERQREELLADAYAQAQAIRGQGDGEAAAIYSDSYGKNPEFYRFYRSLEAYRSAFSKQTDTLVISPDSDFLQVLGQARITRSTCELIPARELRAAGCSTRGPDRLY